MEKRIEITEDNLENITGGKITYSWKEETQTGTIGIDGNNFLILVDKDAFVSYYKSNMATMTDGAILKHLLSTGAVKMP